MQPADEGLVPLDLLRRDDLRRALTEHDFAAVFALLGKYAGLSQNRIALACGLTPGKVSAIVHGRAQVTSFEVVARIADGLRVPGYLLGLAPRAWENQPEPVSAARSALVPPARDDTWTPEASVATAARLTAHDLVNDQPLPRPVLSGAGLLEPLEGWLSPTTQEPGPHRTGRLGPGEAAELERAARAFKRWGHRLGGGLHRKAVLGTLREVAAHLREHQSPKVTDRLLRVMSQLAQTAASMAWDSGLHRTAQDYYLLALRASHAAGDLDFGANILGGMARQMLYRDRPQDALEMIRVAQEGTRATAGPRLRAMLQVREAWAYARMGREAAFQRLTNQAHETLTDAVAGAEAHWIEYFDEAELRGTTGGRYLELARHDPRKHGETALSEITTALAQRGPETGRGHALDRIGLAECYFLLGDLHAAVAETHQAVDAAQNTRSSRVNAKLGELYEYTTSPTASSTVRDARERIRQALAG